MNGLFLYTRVMPYTINGIKSLIKTYDINIHLVHYKLSDLAPYKLPQINNLVYYSEELFDEESILNLVAKLNPKFIFVAGWSNKKYLKVSKVLKNKNIPVITGCDTQWRGGLRQCIAVIFSNYLIRKYFTHIMVAGLYQYEYARLLGFKRQNILTPLYPANIDLFNTIYKNTKSLKTKSYPKNILFVGRLEKVKGLHILIEAFKQISNKNGWTLTIVGNGSLGDQLKMQAKNEPVIFKEFIQPEKFEHEILNAGLFCLPSTYEPWGVVLQEFSAAGLPLITSDTCGANSQFVKQGYNGCTFKQGDVNSLTKTLQLMITKNDSDLLNMMHRSHQIAQYLDAQLYNSNFARFIQ